MSTTARIVVGVDGSPASVTALRWAARQAALTGATLDVITSWEHPTDYGEQMLYIEDFDWAELAHTILSAAIDVAEIDAAVIGRRTVAEGHPTRVLVDASAGADLLVVGSRGHGGFAGLLLGSVSEHVIAHAVCPVLVVRHLPDPARPVGPAEHVRLA